MKKLLLILFAVSLLALSGCALLPQEAQLPSMPLVTGEETPEYEYAYATRGDLLHQETLSCAVTAREEETLSYSLTGEKIRTVYVAAGDVVQAGTLVAELANDEAEQLIARYTAEKAETQAELENLRARAAVCESAPSLAAQAADYARQVQEKEDALAVLELRLTEQEAALEEGRLYASISGVVTYAKASGGTSIRNTAVVTIVSRAQAEYYTDTPFYEALPVGTPVELVIDELAYQAQVTAWEEAPENPGRFGAKEEDTTPKKRVCLTVTDDRAEYIDTSLKGTIDLRLESREDVLLLPSRAVVYAGGQALVYRQEEGSGLMQVQNVSVGLQVDDMIEITGGLAEGDCVIVE